jgi:hypothetical protein
MQTITYWGHAQEADLLATYRRAIPKESYRCINEELPTRSANTV